MLTTPAVFLNHVVQIYGKLVADNGAFVDDSCSFLKVNFVLGSAYWNLKSRFE
jgi:hypothetical protein